MDLRISLVKKMFLLCNIEFSNIVYFAYYVTVYEEEYDFEYCTSCHSPEGSAPEK